MAHFIGCTTGSRGTVSRLGSVKSGIETITNGLDIGVTVKGYVKDGKDVFDIYKNSGSNNHTCGVELIATITD